jgi:hypothetical protein
MLEIQVSPAWYVIRGGRFFGPNTSNQGAVTGRGEHRIPRSGA